VDCATIETGTLTLPNHLLMLHNKDIGRDTNRTPLNSKTMSITLSTNYKETVAPEIVTIVDELVEDGYDLEEVLSVLDYFGEKYQENLKEIFEELENTGALKEELYDYIEEQGVDELGYFEQYQEVMSNYDENAVTAFLSMYSVSDLHAFEESYEGQFDNVRDFVEYILDTVGEEIPSWITVDYEATWNASLRFDYNEEDGYYFRSNW
jgi:hypothetical protein